MHGGFVDEVHDLRAQVARLEGERDEAVKLLKRALAPALGEIPWVREARRFLATLKGSE